MHLKKEKTVNDLLWLEILKNEAEIFYLFIFILFNGFNKQINYLSNTNFKKKTN